MNTHSFSVNTPYKNSQSDLSTNSHTQPIQNRPIAFKHPKMKQIALERSDVTNGQGLRVFKSFPKGTMNGKTPYQREYSSRTKQYSVGAHELYD